MEIRPSSLLTSVRKGGGEELRWFPDGLGTGYERASSQTKVTATWLQRPRGSADTFRRTDSFLYGGPMRVSTVEPGHTGIVVKDSDGSYEQTIESSQSGNEPPSYSLTASETSPVSPAKAVAMYDERGRFSGLTFTAGMDQDPTTPKVHIKPGEGSRRFAATMSWGTEGEEADLGVKKLEESFSFNETTFKLTRMGRDGLLLRWRSESRGYYTAYFPNRLSMRRMRSLETADPINWAKVTPLFHEFGVKAW